MDFHGAVDGRNGAQRNGVAVALLPRELHDMIRLNFNQKLFEG
jgi:hypothetical protein